VYGVGHDEHSVGPTDKLVATLYVCTAQLPHTAVGNAEEVPEAHTVWNDEPAGQELPFVHAVPEVKPGVSQN